MGNVLIDVLEFTIFSPVLPLDSSTGEDDNFTGFDSGWSSADRGRNDEGPRTYPRISRTFSNKRFVTSGVGEDNGGSQDDDGSQSKSNGSQDQGSAYENFESNTDLAKSECKAISLKFKHYVQVIHLLKSIV